MESIFKYLEKYKIQIILIFITVLLSAFLFLFEVKAENKSVECINKDKTYIVGGEAVGIKLLATGVLVMGTDREDVDLKVGDIILEVNGCKIETNAELEEFASLGQELELTISRNDENKNIKVSPKRNNNTGEYRLGLWVKDSSAGVGTITFYEKESGNFAALGHAITETSNLNILPITTGGITKTEIYSIKKGISKIPGELKGTLTNDTLGQIYTNTKNGIFGHIEDNNIYKENDIIEVVDKNSIEIGKAQIIITLENDEKKKYDVEVEKIYINSTDNKNISIKVTDKELIEKTGGIVQGMSGAPIIQNGKLIGCITHVLLDDPQRGYGAFIENMINDLNNI